MHRLLLVSETSQMSGPGNAWLEYVSLLDTAEFQSCLVCPPDGGPLVERFAAIGVPSRIIAYPRLRKTLNPKLLGQFARSGPPVLGQFAAIICEHQSDLVQVNTIINVWGALAAWRAGKPLIWHIHELTPRNWMNHLIHRLVAKVATKVVVVSDSVRQRFLSEGVPEFKLKVIHNGIQLERYDAVTQDQVIETRQALGLSRDTVGIGVLGRIDSGKGHLELIQALAPVIPEHPMVKLVVIGDPLSLAYKQKLQSEIAHLGLSRHIIFTGYRSDIPVLLNSLDLLVMPSVLPDSFPLAVLEAMAASLPVIASQIGGISEEVVHKETGLLVPPGDVTALSMAFRTLLETPQLLQSMGRQGRQRIEQRFTAKRMAESFAELYRNMLS